MASPKVTNGQGTCKLIPNAGDWKLASIQAATRYGKERWFGKQIVNKGHQGVVNIVLRKGWRMTGRVAKDGKPAANLKVVLNRSFGSGDGVLGPALPLYFEAVKTKHDGTYVFVVPPDDVYSIHVASPIRSRRGVTLFSPKKVSLNEYQFEDVKFTTPGTETTEKPR
jgi:hypothetical protein